MKKNIAILMLLALFVIVDISCNTGEQILAKFHQFGFKIKDVRTELVRYNKKYFNSYSIRTFKYNRTTPAINTTFNLKRNLKDKIEAVLQAYKFTSNEYRFFPTRFQVNLQKAFTANAIGFRSISNCGNITSFIFEKDVTYHSCNFVIDETRFPPLVPNGKFKVEANLTYLNEEILVTNCFLEIYTPIAYPKN